MRVRVRARVRVRLDLLFRILLARLGDDVLQQPCHPVGSIPSRPLQSLTFTGEV